MANSKTTKNPKPERTKKKYTESHWLIFAIEGILSLILGGFIMFADTTTTAKLILAVAITLIAIGFIEIINVIARYRHHHSSGLTLAIALIEIAVAVALLLTRNLNIAVPLTIIAGYTITRGLFEVLIALRSLTDATDRFLWIITGTFGMILGFVIFNSGNIDLQNTTFLKLFGTYMAILGVANIVFAIHSKNATSRPKGK